MKTLSYSIYFIFLFPILGQDYLWPTNASNTLTAFFGEERPQRYHAGIDIRTYGKNGFEIYAIEDGYIERIKTNYKGYGKTIYLRLDDGNLAVYAHLEKFYPELDQIIKILNKQYDSSVINHRFNKQELRVKKGDIIGYTGDTGTLSGPHLHFEIRDKNNKSLNPLEKFYAINDSKKPIPRKIAFIPNNHETKINGFNNIDIIDIIKGENNQYFLKDTISIVGEFGISLNIHDKIDNQPFSYGVYNIELYLNGDIKYKVQYDTHDFSQGKEILNERNYFLKRQENQTYYNLFSTDSDLTFIDKKSHSSYEIQNGVHNMVIKASDINGNEITIFGQIIGQNISKLNFNVIQNEETIDFIIEESDIHENYFIEIGNKYNSDVIETFKFSKKKISIDKHILNDPFNCITIYGKAKNGLSSYKNFYKNNSQSNDIIEGKFNFLIFNDGVIVQFIENEFSNQKATISLITKNQVDYETNRISKNMLSTNKIYFSDFENLNQIKINYESEINYEIIKEINSAIYYPKDLFYLSNNEINVNFSNSFKDSTLVIIEKENNYNNESLDFKSNSYKILPSTIPFKNYARINFNHLEDDGIGVYFYDKKNQKWKFLETEYLDGDYSAEINSNEIFAIIQELEPPIIKNLKPDIDANYRAQDINKIEFYVEDNLSGISNIENISLKFDGEPLLFDFNLYQKKISYEFEDWLTLGAHNIEIKVIDNVGNATIKKGTFNIK